MSSQKALASLRSKTLKAARGFSDYNFRKYFVRHTKERFDTFDASAATPEALAKFQLESTDNLKQMRRMALLNTMYADQHVVLDTRGSSVSPAAARTKDGAEGQPVSSK